RTPPSAEPRSSADPPAAGRREARGELPRHGDHRTRLYRPGPGPPGWRAPARGSRHGRRLHPGAVPESEYQREADLVYDVIRRCTEQDQLLVYFSTASANMYGAVRG